MRRLKEALTCYSTMGTRRYWPRMCTAHGTASVWMSFRATHVCAIVLVCMFLPRIHAPMTSSMSFHPLGVVLTRQRVTRWMPSSSSRGATSSDPFGHIVTTLTRWLDGWVLFHLLLLQTYHNKKKTYVQLVVMTLRSLTRQSHSCDHSHRTSRSCSPPGNR